MSAPTVFPLENDRRLIWLSGRVMALGDFVTGLIGLGLHFISELKLVFQEIINPRADFFNLRARKLWQNRCAAGRGYAGLTEKKSTTWFCTKLINCAPA